MSRAEEEKPSTGQPFWLPAGVERTEDTIGVNRELQIVSLVGDQAHIFDWSSSRMRQLADIIKRASREKRRREKASGS